jgi:GWxTD domain-containing protein
MKKYFIAFIFICSITVFAQEDFKFEFDFAQFGYDSTSNYVEIYYSFPQNDLTLQNENGTTFVSGFLEISIEDTANAITVVDNIWRVNNQIDTSKINSTSLLGQIGFVVKKGEYVCKIKGFDSIDTLNSKSYLEDMEIIPLIKKNRYSISDIQLASNIKSENANQNSLFYKNTMEVTPNPMTFYSETMPVLFYYSELYNLNLEKPNEKLEVQKLVYNGSGKLIHKKSKMISRDKKSIVEAGAVNLSKYPTDSYTFVVALVDTSAEGGVASSKRLFLYNPSIKQEEDKTAENLGYIGSEYGVLSDEDCDIRFKQAKYIASNQEIEQYESLDSLDSKRKYLYEFWLRRDTNPQTAVNEFREDYLKRVKLANDRYRTMNKDGYRTDRGRVMLVYGMPDQIDRYPNETNLKPYELWSYNSIEGGVVFVFGDITGFSDYELLHSTARGEIQDRNWQRRISAN